MRHVHAIPVLAALGLGVGAFIAASPGSGHESTAAEAVAESLSIIDLAILGVAALSVAGWFVSRAHRLPRRPADALTLPPEWLFGLLAGMLIAPLVGMQVLAMADPAAASAMEAARAEDASPMTLPVQVKLTIAATLGQVLLGGVYLSLLGGRRTTHSSRGSAGPRRWSRITAAAAGAFALVGVFPVVLAFNALVTLIVVKFGDEAPPQIAHQTLESILVADERIWKAVMIGLVVVVVPTVEEFLYRGIVQELLSRLRAGHWPAIIVTSAAFSIAHIGSADWHVLPSLFVLSLALGWIYARSGRLIASIMLHAAFNAANVALGMLVTGGGA